MIFRVFILLMGIFIPVFCRIGKENHKNVILEKIKKLQIENQRVCPTCLFFTVWDFDGTILKGDCTEGLWENGEKIYPGLVEVFIENGLYGNFRGADGFFRFWQEYKAKEEINPLEAYTWAVKNLAKNPKDKIYEIAQQHFESQLKNYYFASSYDLLKELYDAHIKTLIISASADIFVKAALKSLPDPETLIFGIAQKEKNGYLTENIVMPITYAEGKTEKLKLVLKEIEEKEKRPVYILAGFGNSFHTDGPFLKFILEQKLPSGKPISVMINGGQAPKEYENLFFEVSQKETKKF